MVTFFTEKYTEVVVDYLKQIWRDDCKAEESFSAAKFKEKENFFLNNTESGLRWKEEEKETKPSQRRGNQPNSGRYQEQNNTRRNNQVIPVTQKESKIPEEILERNRDDIRVIFENGKRMPRFQRKNQRSRYPNKERRTVNPDKFEVGALDKLRLSRTTSLASISSNVTVVPETQDVHGTEDENNSFLFHGQGARNQDHE